MDVTIKDGSLAGLTGRFITETNAFLARHWDDPTARWPLKPTRSPCGRLVDAAVNPELLAEVQRLRQQVTGGGDRDVERRLCLAFLLLSDLLADLHDEDNIHITAMGDVPPAGGAGSPGSPVSTSAPRRRRASPVAREAVRSY